MVRKAALALALIAAPANAQTSKGLRTQMPVQVLPDSAETMRYAESGLWHIRIDLTLNGGCFANMVYDDYSYIRFTVSPNERKLFMMVGNALWRSLLDAPSRVVAVALDDHEPWSADASTRAVGGINYLVFELGETAFVNEFRQSRMMGLASDKKLIGVFDLDGSAKAVEKVIECQAFVDKAVDPFSEK